MKKLPKVLLFISIIFITSFVYSLPLRAQDNKNDPPWQSPRTGTEPSTSNFGARLVSFYGDYISPIDGSRCPSIPSCSTYSLRAFKKHGFIMGWLMTVDRLIHEGREETAVSPVVYSEGKWKIFDPLKNNDFWWFHDKEREGIQDE